MAKLEKVIQDRSFDDILDSIEQGIMHGSATASLEDKSDFAAEGSRCAVRVFERYSMLGSNRVSLSVTLFQGADGVIRLSAITSGGSQAMFFKINTLGEEAFLEQLEKLL